MSGRKQRSPREAVRPAGRESGGKRDVTNAARRTVTLTVGITFRWRTSGTECATISTGKSVISVYTREHGNSINPQGNCAVNLTLNSNVGVLLSPTLAGDARWSVLGGVHTS